MMVVVILIRNSRSSGNIGIKSSIKKLENSYIKTVQNNMNELLKLMIESSIPKPSIFSNNIDNLYKYANGIPLYSGQISKVIQEDIVSIRKIEEQTRTFLTKQLINENHLANRLSSHSVKGIGLKSHAETLRLNGGDLIKSNTEYIVAVIVLSMINNYMYFFDLDANRFEAKQKETIILFKDSVERYSEIRKIIAYKIYQLEGGFSFASTDKEHREVCFQAMKTAESNKPQIIGGAMKMMFSIGQLIDQL
jgi:hypothetical protein